MTQPTRDSRTAVDKALALLGAFGADASAGVGVTELARRTGLSKSTAFRVLAMLENNGAVERAGTKYRLGPLLGDLAAPVESPEVDRIREVLTPFLAHLYERTRQTVHLAVLDGDAVVYLNKLHGLHNFPSPSRIGGRLPAYCTAVGKAMVAHSPSPVIEQVLSEELAPWTPHTITDPEVLRAEFAQIRKEGVAYDRMELSVGLICVAAPVFDVMHQPLAALSVSGRTGRYDPRTLAGTLREVANEATKAYAARRRSERKVTPNPVSSSGTQNTPPV